MKRALLDAALLLAAGYLAGEKLFTFYGDGALKRKNAQLARDLQVAHLALERQGLLRPMGEVQV